MDTKEKYLTDVELVSDFMNLALLYDNNKSTKNEKQEILTLEKEIINLLPIAQSNRMTTIYSLMNEIYKLHANEKIEQLNDNANTNDEILKDYYLVLFYDRQIPSVWSKFEQFVNKNKIINTKVYDKNDPRNNELINYLNINEYPYVAKLQLDGSTQDYLIKMNKSLTLNNLTEFIKN